MRKIFLSILSLSIIIVLTTMFFSHSHAYTITQLTHNDYNDWNPQINANGYVVWQGGYGGSTLEIFLYDGSTITQLTDNGYPDAVPQINANGYVVWEGGYVVWEGGYDGSNLEIFLLEIFLYDGSTITQLTHNDYNDEYPQINANGYVVWQGHAGPDWEIFLYDGSTITQLTHNDYYYDWSPQINANGYVVWQGGSAGTDCEIFLYDGSTITQLTHNDYYDRSPQINANGYVVWEGEYGGTDCEIFLYDGSTITQLTHNDYPDEYPQINANGYVVWQGYDGTDYEIFLYDGSTITQLTDNDYPDEYPQINANGYVVWQGYDGTDWEIFLALQPPIISFLDKENTSREVIGAAADGASKVIIQISNLGDDVSVNDIEITIVDKDGNPIPDDQDGHLENDKEIIDGVFTQTYVAPENFVREGQDEDLTQGKREIHFSITVNGQEVEHPQFFLIKPPIVLLHGLWSYSDVWDKLKEKLVDKEHGYGYEPKYIVAFQYFNSASFEQLKSVIDNAIDAVLIPARIDGYVAKKADVVAHSMGGVITKLYGHESNIRSITTVGTPHFGSPLADILWFLVDDDPNPFQEFIAHCFENSPWPVKNGAIKDLRVNGGQHCKVNNNNCKINVPNYVISGISPLTNQTTILFVNLLAKVFKFSGLLSWSATLLDLNQLIFKGERNDWIVSESSQEGYWEGDDDYVLWHFTETIDEEVLQKIINFLHRTQSTESMFQSTSIESQEKSRLRYALPVFGMGISSGFVEITHPIEGQVFQPGDTVDVEVNSSNEDAMVIITTSTGESTLMDHAPYNFQFVIPNEVIGPLNIVVGARDDTGFIGSDEVTINVVSSSNLINIKIYPEINPLYISIEVTVPLTVYGLYDDGITRQITSSGSGTSYVSSNPGIVEVSPEGLLTVKSQGEAIVTIENSGVRKEITVIGIEPCEGDFDGDRDIDGSDLAIFAAAFGSVSGDPNYDPRCDFGPDGDVDDSDLAVFAADFGRTNCPLCP